MRELSEQCKFYVYAHKRLCSNAVFYIGKGSGERLNKRSHRNKHWHNIVAKDGGFNTEIIIKDIDEEFAFLIEREAIALAKLRGVNLVNVTLGGDGATGLRHSEEWKSALSKRMIGNTYTLGYRHTDEAKAKIGASSIGNKNSLGRKLSDEHRKKFQVIWDARRGVPLSESVIEKMRGRKVSDEERARMSERMTGRKISEETRQRMSGRVWTPEQREAARIKMTGSKLTEETKLKMSVSQKRIYKTSDNHAFKRGKK